MIKLGFRFFAIIVLSFIGSGLICAMLQMAGKKDNAVLLLQKKEIPMIFISMGVCIALLNVRYGNTLRFAMYSYLTMYLLLTAIIDKKTTDVYCVFNYISMGIGIAYFAFRYHSIGQGALADIQKHSLLLSLGAFFVLLMFAKLIHLYSTGDGEIFLALSLFVMADGSGMNNLFRLYLCYVLALTLITVGNLKEIDWKTKKFKKPMPFAPSIFLSTIVILLLG